MNLFQLPQVDPMMVRQFSFAKTGIQPSLWRDKVVINDLVEFECTEIGLAESRLLFDEDVIDQSNGVFEFTNMVILGECGADTHRWAIFTSRRWRTHRDGNECQNPLPSFEFIGNPIIIDAVKNKDNTPSDRLYPIVYREKSYLIKTGMQILHEKEYGPLASTGKPA